MIDLPKFTIALPVYNGGALLKKCVESILSQSYKDFVLQIFNSYDNTDGSTEYLNSIQDSRIQILQATEKLSIEQNWARFKDAFISEFATIVGQDDILHCNFLEEFLHHIERNPEASLWHSNYDLINSSGEIIGKNKPMPPLENCIEYLQSILQVSNETIGTGYVFRCSDYKKVGGIPLFTDLLFADFALWLKLTSISFKANFPTVLFSFRIHESTTSKAPPQRYFSAFRQFLEFLQDFSNTYEEVREILEVHINEFLSFYSEQLSLRIIRNEKIENQRLTVAQVLNYCRNTSSNFKSRSIFQASRKNLAFAMIDRSELFRQLYKIYYKKTRNK